MSSPVPATDTYGHRLYVGHVGIHNNIHYVIYADISSQKHVLLQEKPLMLS